MTNVLVLMTAATKREAQKIAQKLLDKHLIACANIYGPVESRYRWQGKIEKAREFLVLMKSSQRLFAALSESVREIHSYEVPEVLALPIVEGFKPYLDWLNTSLADSGES